MRYDSGEGPRRTESNAMEQCYKRDVRKRDGDGAMLRCLEQIQGCLGGLKTTLSLGGGGGGSKTPLHPTKISLLVKKNLRLTSIQCYGHRLFWVWIQNNYKSCPLRASRFEKKCCQGFVSYFLARILLQHLPCANV